MPIPESSICLEYKSKVGLNKCDFELTAFKPLGPLTEAIRFSLKRSSGGKKLMACCYANNLEQIGLTVKAVTCSQGDPEEIVELKRIKKDNRIPLYYWIFEVDKTDSVLDFACVFRIYVTGCVEQYTQLRFDRLLGEQMWKAAMEQRMIDIELSVGGRTFYAHKFILAARSRVFRSKFDGDIIKRVSSESVDPDIVEQFLRFLYTGQLSQPIVSTELGQLAEKYEVEALVSLCREATLRRAPINSEEMVDLVSSVDSPSKSDKEEKTTHHVTSKQWFDPSFLYSETFAVQVDDVRRGDCKWLQRHAFLYKFEPSTQVIKFFSCGQVATDVGVAVDRVELYVQHLADRKSEHHECDSQRVTMKPWSQEYHPKTFKQFGTRDVDFKKFSYPTKLLLQFIVHRSPLVESFNSDLRDSSYASEMWSAVENKLWTDVEFKVGDKIFSAHRALLSARCPALAALIPIEPSSAPVHIDNFRSTVFEELLYFLYTGQLRVKDFESLQCILRAGETFQVDTLQKLAKWTRYANPDEISRKLMSFFV